MSDAQHTRRIEGWLRIGVVIAVPLTVAVGLWLLLTHPEARAPTQPTDGSAHVSAFPATPGPPTLTLTPAVAPSANPSTR